MLKVLHVHDSSLDDPRIINAAATDRKAGYEPHFCGALTPDHIDSDIFAGYHWIEFPYKARMAQRLTRTPLDNLWHSYPYPREAILMEKQLRKVIENVRPDMIHAHNIFAAYHCHQLGISMVFDDHEYYSLQLKTKNLSGLKAQIKQKHWEEKEQLVAEHHPVITVSESIAEYYKAFAEHTCVVPNYPQRNDINPEIKMFSANEAETLVSAYLGADSITNSHPVRDITGLHDIFNGNGTGKLAKIGVKSPNTNSIRSYGNIPMFDAYNILQTRCHIGLLPWVRHWFHKYACPNKVYEYAHTGCYLLITDDMKFIIEDFNGHCDTFADLEALEEKLHYYNDNRIELDKKRDAMLHFAKSHLSWENKEHLILEAYKKA